MCSGIQVGDVISTCVQLTNGSWSLASTLRHPRQLHCAWRTERGLVLLGGESSRNTSELLTGDGESEEHFPLKYETRLAVSSHKYNRVLQKKEICKQREILLSWTP